MWDPCHGAVGVAHSIGQPVNSMVRHSLERPTVPWVTHFPNTNCRVTAKPLARSAEMRLRVTGAIDIGDHLGPRSTQKAIPLQSRHPSRFATTGRPPVPPAAPGIRPPGDGRRVVANARNNYERYTTMAKDAARRGDDIEAENCYQHAEHYFRLMREQGS